MKQLANMSRRKMLGFLGGAAAAGPKLAQGIAANVAPMMPSGGLGVPIGGMQAAMPAGDWRSSRIADLKAIISGKSEETKRDRQMRRLQEAETFERFRLDGLRSVSTGHKYRMFTKGQLERSDRIRRLYAEFELSDLLSGKFG